MKRKVGIILLFLSFFLCAGFTLAAPKADAGNAPYDTKATVTLSCQGRLYVYKDDFISAPDHLVAEEIELRRINAPIPEKLKTAEKCFAAGGTFKTAMLRPFPLLEKVVDKIVLDTDARAVDSEISFNPLRRPMFSITRDKDGYEISEEILYRDIYSHLRRQAKTVLNVSPKVLKPEITMNDNIALTRMRSRFVTDYSESCPERKSNIALALNKISGSRLEKDQEFSFNGKVGRRNEKNGFKMAKIIVGGEYVDGFGGGVCQASTTVYNAALLADMEITQARNHSLAPAYVKPSFDAMVNQGSSDLKFKNTGERPVFIRAYGNGRQAVVEFYGSPLPYKISCESVTVSKLPPPPDKEEIDTDYKYLPPTAPPGEKMRIANAHGAIKSEGYLVYRSPLGGFIEKKLIRRDSYQSVAGVVMVAPARAGNGAYFNR